MPYGIVVVRLANGITGCVNLTLELEQVGSALPPPRIYVIVGYHEGRDL